ncbi:hypothetical protein ABZ776_01155 [Streptomyces sp. NPDC007076]|uniref:hypothetical protein n=1 Tax=unclassified Streptomyces TaxID=2593676 RepID=UPI002E77E557|nr:hypothetical protein [Streptomyces sp. JV190]MEE1840313.1 hypothetical protein [Streptomyces sp. JV190]
MSTWSAAELDVLIEEATVDTYDEIEAVNGFLAVIEEHLAVPFPTTVLGVEANVVEIGLTNDSRVVARCVRDGFRQDIALLDLPLPVPPPDGAQWVEAYRRWSGCWAGAPR